MTYAYAPQGICAQQITFDWDEQTNAVTNIAFMGGCNGNLKTIAMLLDGWTPEDIATKLSGNTCGRKPTSCADQLARAMAALKAGEFAEANTEEDDEFGF